MRRAPKVTGKEDPGIWVLVSNFFSWFIIGGLLIPGPEFDHLDETVQEAFGSYLAERGVDESLGKVRLGSTLIKMLSCLRSRFCPLLLRAQRAKGV